VPPAFAAHPLLFLSTAPVDTLQLLPGIGPVLADRIAQARGATERFTAWEQLRAVRGIGPKTIEKLQALTTTTR
jgi:competence protein ComEA